MKNKYLTERERYQIEVLLKQKTPVKEIAEILGKSKSTIYREIKLGTVEMLDHTLLPYKKYCADAGQRIQDERSHNKGKSTTATHTTQANAVAMRTQTSSFAGGFPKVHISVSLQTSISMNCKIGLTIIPVRFLIICLQMNTRHS